MRLFSLSEITGKAQNAIKRFPVTLVWAICGTLFCIVVVNDGSRDLFDDYSAVFLTLVLGISWLIGMQFLLEQTARPKKWIWLKAVILLLLFAFYWHLPDSFRIENEPEYLLRFFLYGIAGHLFVLFAPFLFNWNKEAYWNYLKSIGTAILRSGFFSGVLFLGLVLALVAIDALFDAKIDGKRYGQLFIFCLGIVNTWIYLSDFPKSIQQDTTIIFNKALEVFVKYILIPLVLLYLAILYAYGGKILLEWELPKGWVSYLVTALALLGFVVQIIINPVQKTMKSWTIRVFHPFFYILLLPLVALLFVAIYRRVSDYGITENRYFVIVLAFWILGMALYLLLAKNRRLILLPFSLFLIALLTSFGYWSAVSVSLRSQFGQFQNVLESVKANENVSSPEQHEQLRSILEYMYNRRALSKLDPITNMAMEETFVDTTDGKLYGYRWFNTRRVLDSLGISIDPEALNPDGEYGIPYNYFDNEYAMEQSYRIGDFDYFMPLQLNRYTEKTISLGSISAQYDNSRNTLIFIESIDSTEVFELSLREKLLELTKFNSQLPKEAYDQLTLNFKNERILGKLIFKDLSYNIKNDSISLDHSRAYLFLKLR
ncbi:DUF4153 domain-containing protein [Aggregatimonas sangjinii]|uniref:DUF4153 domain-containing protein n=1 Tax=Aggregatimonas sangjinii TaxID=2583587 RepID=A0A5B7SY99_9FLAO|nr:DUF4153 domain-containing protein [Aggregatimonas sangjinii]QCX01740.1 DUF4153 domain-containing protein [Aggregatimonas sangjinii]